MDEIRSHTDLFRWSPPRRPGRAARLQRFAALRDFYVRAFGPLPLVVKITGTAGKGSVAAMLEAALRADGITVGLFTSPHLVSVTERIRIDGADVAAAELDRIAIETQAFFREFMAVHGEAARPAFFEALLILALRLFAEARCQVILAEVAIGGYNDVLSLLASPIAVITSIGEDHAEELGPTATDVARDKAGIATDGSVLVLGPGIGADAVGVIDADVRAREVRLAHAAEIRAHELADTRDGQEVAIDAGGEVRRVQLPLRGRFQIDNLRTAAMTLRVLQQLRVVRNIECIAGVAHTRWHGRLECFDDQPSWLVDSAHNGLAFKALAEFLGPLQATNPRTLLFGASDPDKAAMGIASLAPLFSSCHLVEGFYHAVSVQPLVPLVMASCGVMPQIFREPAAAVEWLTAPASGVRQVVVAGSVYLGGACRELLVLRRQQVRALR